MSSRGDISSIKATVWGRTTLPPEPTARAKPQPLHRGAGIQGRFGAKHRLVPQSPALASPRPPPASSARGPAPPGPAPACCRGSPLPLSIDSYCSIPQVISGLAPRQLFNHTKESRYNFIYLQGTNRKAGFSHVLSAAPSLLASYGFSARNYLGWLHPSGIKRFT